ncbi:MAG: DUF2179 domain-containing protein [Clostridia bacterium]|nr:DUF2179 domain-containing protein [Clostridia bacterium]
MSETLTYYDIVTDAEVVTATDASGDFVLPTNGVSCIDISTYRFIPEEVDDPTDFSQTTFYDTTGTYQAQAYLTHAGWVADSVQGVAYCDKHGVTIQRPNEVFPIHVTAGLMDFSAKNLTGRKWYFADGTTSTAERPAKTLSASETVYLTGDFSNSSTLEVNDNGTDARYTGDLSDLPALTYYLNLYNCPNITGDLFDVRQGRRLFPILTACQMLGTTLGNFAAAPLAIRAGFEPLLLICAAFGIALAVVIGIRVPRLPGAAALRHPPGEKTRRSPSEIIAAIRDAGYAVSVVEVLGSKFGEQKYMLFIEIESAKQKEIRRLIHKMDVKAFIMVQESRSVYNGYFGK